VTSLLLHLAHVSPDNAVHFDAEVGLLLGGLLLVAIAIIWLI
jgi:hypothetical protein